MRISDWSSDVCSSDLVEAVVEQRPQGAVGITVVIFLDILLRQVDRARGDAAIGLDMEIMPRADVARPAEPDAVAFPERRGERDGKPTLRRGLFGLGGGNPVRDDDQAAQGMVIPGLPNSSDEPRVGKEWASPGRSREGPSH